jgi:glyoxylase-like metal-dependent hydrolase (beta-lactamase superfamily II)
MSNLITLTHRGTHTFLLDLPAGKLMVDAGWPDALPVLKRQLAAYGVPPSEIRLLFLTHTHPDHAGLAQPIKALTGARLLIHETQVVALPALARAMAGKSGDPPGGYVPIVVEPPDVVLRARQPGALRALGVAGQAVETPGHSHDSVSLLLDDGRCFIGDLTPPQLAPDEAAAAVLRESWRRLLALGARRFYPAHGSDFEAASVDGL